MASSALTSVSTDDLVTLDRGNNTTARVHFWGATIVSWQKDGEELLFLSSKAILNNEKAIRGGIPVVFPCFGPWALGPAHGFARISRWKLTQPPTKDDQGDVSVIFSLTDSEATRKLWNHKFRLNYKIILKESELVNEFTVENKGDDVFTFTCLLHTYFKVADITKVTVSNLKGLSYIDKVADGACSVEERELVTIAENVDRVYKKTQERHTIGNVSQGRDMEVSKVNFPDTVVWNPWKEKALAMADLGDEDYLNMVCVEAGYVDEMKSLSPHQVFTASQTLKANL